MSLSVNITYVIIGFISVCILLSAVVIQVCIQNRYKLNKKYRNALSSSQAEYEPAIPDMVKQAKMAAEAEDNDNAAEQKRQHGKRVRYGEIVQLKHCFTSKYLHMCTTQTSQHDKNNMMISLNEFNAKNAQFRILPRYKVKSEGEVVQLFDQIVFESVKSPGHFFHASEKFQIYCNCEGSELNLGVEKSSFTLVGCYREDLEDNRFVRGGSVIRLFHKELEAYLVAEGLFDEIITENVHFRIRVMDQHHPKTMSPSTSGNTYWQIECESSILDGEVLNWEQQIRLRHLATRQYLCINSKSEVSLTTDQTDPRTVFRLHSVLKERNQIQFESYARIEHMLTGYWLHALKDEDYERHSFEEGNGRSMSGLRWDGASTRKVSSSNESQYDDAYTLQYVDDQAIKDFNFVAGMVPFLYNLVNRSELHLNARITHGIIAGMKELKTFIIPDGRPDKNRQKLMRNLRVIDLLVKILQLPLQGAEDESYMIRIFKEAYDVLHAYMIGRSRKNALYFAKYIDFFQTQFSQKGGIGLNVAQMIVELIRDKRKIVDRIGHSNIELFINLLRENPNYRFLDLLQVLCVCNDVAIPNNQSYIVQQWLRTYKAPWFNKAGSFVQDWNLPATYEALDSVYLMDRGQNINRRPNIVYVSVDGGTTWVPLHSFVNPESNDYVEEKYKFLIHQLDLFKALSFGRNDFAIHVITREYGYVTWEDCFLCLQSDLLPDAIRAKYCELIIALFVDVGNNYSVLDHPNICFVYEYVGSKDSERDQSQYPPDSSLGTNEDIQIVKDLVTIFPVLRDWLADFLAINCIMTASLVGHNLLIEQVLRLLQYLVKFGYYMDMEDVKQLMQPLLSLLDGRHDIPFPEDKVKDKEKRKDSNAKKWKRASSIIRRRTIESYCGYSKESQKIVNHYRLEGRYEKSLETEAIVDAKYQAMDVLDLLFTYQRNIRLKAFVTKFKNTETQAGRRKYQINLESLLYETYNPQDQSKKCLKKQRELIREIREMFHNSSIFNIEDTTAILLDLSNYKYDQMVIKSLDIMNKMYSSQDDMFKLASQALVLTQDSARVHREVQRALPILRRLSRAKLNEQQVKLMSKILDELAEFCHLPKTPEEPHYMNQNIMISHGILKIVLDVLSQEIDFKLLDQYGGMKTILEKTLYLLKLLIKENHQVQSEMFEKLDTLLEVKVVESELAIALREVFVGNQLSCLKINSRQIQKIVLLASENQEKAPEFLDLLRSLVKVEGLDVTLKHNQTLVMKYIMQNFKKAAYVLDQHRNVRERILIDNTKKGHRTYFISLVDLLATCAEGENKFIDSLCQTILPFEELLWILNHSEIDNKLKTPFLKFILGVYVKPNPDENESSLSDIQHDKKIWEFLCTTVQTINDLFESVTRYRERTAALLKTYPDKSAIADSSDTRGIVHGNLYYVLEGVLPFLHVFYMFYYMPDKTLFANEITITENLAKELVTFKSVSNNVIGLDNKFTSTFCELVSPMLVKPFHMKNVVSSLTSVVSNSIVSKTMLIGVLEKFSTEINFEDDQIAIRRGNMEYYAAEIELNAKFHTFARNCKIVYCGHNTVAAQLKCKHIKNQYTIIGGDEELPLGDEFQSFVRCFVAQNEKKLANRYAPAKKLVDLLAISIKAHTASRTKCAANEELDIKCLQLLRAIVMNDERKLPEDWETRSSTPKIKKQTDNIREIQNAINSHNAIITSLPHLARKSEAIIREVLSFMVIMLFNANRNVQKSLYDYFLSTREEVFFMAVRYRMQVSTNSIKEHRYLMLQQNSRYKDPQNQASVSFLTIGRKALQQIQMYETKLRNERLNGWNALNKAKQPTQEPRLKRSLSWRKKKVDDRKLNKKNALLSNGTWSRDNEALISKCDIELSDVYIEEPVNDFEQQQTSEDVPEIFEYKDDGYIELVLKLLARICDGQNTGIQNYLREQPDNLKSFNIVGETAQFLNVVYTNISEKTIDLVIQLFSTLNEFCSGNQENRVVIYDMKVIDYINFILRSGEFSNCPQEKALELRICIARLIISLIEENGPGASQVAKEVKDTVDKMAIYRGMTSCYEMAHADKKTFEDVMRNKQSSGYLKSAKSLAQMGGTMLGGVLKGKKNSKLKDTMMEAGFLSYFIIARMNDIDPYLHEELTLTPEQQKALSYYKKNSQSIEIVKDDVLQKINFRVRNKNVLREEVKEKLKWNVDRSSPSNKIRDLMGWTKDIMKDIMYQRKILCNPIAIFFTHGWLLWNHGATILSLAINILMLITWNSRASMEDFLKINENNLTEVNFMYNEIQIASPVIEKIPTSDYEIIMFTLAIIHNVFSLFVLVSYLLSNHPRLPSRSEITSPLRRLCSKINEEENEQLSNKDTISKLDVKFFSFRTFYYMAFLGMSIAGTFYGYFFAFHLLNVVNNNQLLSGVIKAVTQNGYSLLWVAILGIIVIYIYSLIGFALMRQSFNPKDYLYCDTLWQCTITVIRYGLIGDMFEILKQSDKERSFGNFWQIALYHVSFFIFITTIGLNIIFGIIVDTFSELRDLKWRAESDMKDTCFICCRNSHDFEHHGKGFDHHVKNEHNMWAYIFFLIHLESQKSSDYTALELFVYKLKEKENFDFIPLNRALCLSTSDLDSTESKIDELLHHVTAISHKQQEDESEKKRRVEKKRQRKWQDKHRRIVGMIVDNEEESEPLLPSRALSQDRYISGSGRPNPISSRVTSKEISSDTDSSADGDGGNYKGADNDNGDNGGGGGRVSNVFPPIQEQPSQHLLTQPQPESPLTITSCPSFTFSVADGAVYRDVGGNGDVELTAMPPTPSTEREQQQQQPEKIQRQQPQPETLYHVTPPSPPLPPPPPLSWSPTPQSLPSTPPPPPPVTQQQPSQQQPLPSTSSQQLPPQPPPTPPLPPLPPSPTHALSNNVPTPGVSPVNRSRRPLNRSNHNIDDSPNGTASLSSSTASLFSSSSYSSAVSSTTADTDSDSSTGFYSLMPDDVSDSGGTNISTLSPDLSPTSSPPYSPSLSSSDTSQDTVEEVAQRTSADAISTTTAPTDTTTAAPSSSIC